MRVCWTTERLSHMIHGCDVSGELHVVSVRQLQLPGIHLKLQIWTVFFLLTRRYENKLEVMGW